MADRRIPPRPGVEVYINKTGLICIRQHDEYASEDDQPAVVLEPSMVPKVIEFLQESLDEYLANRAGYQAEAPESARYPAR